MSATAKGWSGGLRGPGASAAIRLFRHVAAWLALMSLAGVAAQAETLRIASGARGSLYERFAQVVAQSAADAEPRLRIELVSTGGSFESARLLHDGLVDLAIMQGNTAAEQLADDGLFGGILSLYGEAVHVAALGDTPSDTVDDLRGRRVYIGEEGSGTKEDARRILNALGVYQTEFNPVVAPFAEFPRLVEEREVDAAFLVGSTPNSRLSELRSACHLIDFDSDQINTLLNQFDYLVPIRIQAATYAGQSEDVETVGIRALLVGSRRLDADFVRSLIETLLSNERFPRLLEEMGEGTSPSDLARHGMTLPLHEGASDYFRYRIVVSTVFSEWLPDVLLICGLVLFWLAVSVGKLGWTRSVRHNIYLKLIAVFASIYILATSMIHIAERNRTPGFESLPRAFWSTTVYVLSGLESREPRTPLGRAGLTILLFASLGILGSITGKFASLFIENKEVKMAKDITNHIPICNFNAHGDVLVKEIHAPEAEPELEIVVLTSGETHEAELRQTSRDQESDRYSRVFFVHSDPQFHEVLDSARAHFARTIVILSDERSADPDADSALISLAIGHVCDQYGIHGEQRPHIVAESANHRKMQHLRDAGVDEIVCAADYGLGILAQCTLHRHLSRVYDRLLHYTDDTNEIYVVENEALPKNAIGSTFNEIARAIHRNHDPDNPAIPMGIRKKDCSITLNPRGKDGECMFEEGDSLIVIAFTRPNLSRIDAQERRERAHGRA